MIRTYINNLKKISGKRAGTGPNKVISFCQLSTRRKKHRIKESGIKTSLEKLGTKNEWLDIPGEIIT